MNLSKLFILRPIMTTLVMLAIAFFGFIAFDKLPVSDLPNVDYPTISVQVSYPGADPETMANNVTTPLEKKLMTIDGLSSISSSSSSSSSSIVLQFNLGKTMNEAAQDVQSMINQATPQLPQDLPYSPIYNKVNPSASPILYYALTSPSMTMAELRDYADNVLAQRINIVKGVSEVKVFGAPWAVRVQIDPQKLAAKNMSLEEVAQAIKSNNVSLPAGTLYGPNREYTLRVNGQILKPTGYENLILKTEDGSIVRLSDVGRAFNSLSYDKFFISYLEGGVETPTIVMAVNKQPGENAIAVIQRIKEILPTLEAKLPASIKLHTIVDKTEFIEESVEDVQLTLIIAFALVVLVIFFFLGKALDTIIPALALPFIIIGTFAAMSLMDFTIDILSLLAITLSIGFLVDDAIVVLENIVRHVELGANPKQAALDGSKEISVTILSMTLCLATVFVPMAFLGGVIGLLFREFSVVIIVAVLISGFVSLSLTPMLCSRLIPKKDRSKKKGVVARFSDALNHILVKYYKGSLIWALKHRFIILILAIASLGGTVYLFNALPRDFLPGDDIGMVQGFSQMQDGTSPFEMMEKQRLATQMIKDNPYFKSMISLGGIPGDNKGIFFIPLISPNKRPSTDQIIGGLFAKLNSIPGYQAFFKPLPLIDLQVGAGSAMGDYQYTLQSLEPKDLYKYATILERKIKALPGFTQVSSDLHISQPQVNLDIKRDRAAMLNVTTHAIETTLGYAFGGSNLSPIQKPDGLYYVVMEMLPEFYKDPKALSQIYVRSTTGDLVPLDNVVNTRIDVGPQSVHHLDGLPSVTIAFNLQDIPLGTAIDELNKVARETLPPTVSASVRGAADVFKSSFADLPFLLIITIFIIYVVLGILYENFFHPITVMSTLPPAALGGLLVLFFTGYPLSLYAFVGIIMLLGIVLKNGIILVDFANEAIDNEKMSSYDAVVHAAITRFRPIIMTTVAALMGAVPIAIGVGGVTAQGRRPLGMVIVGGLIISQILTLYFTPVVFVYIENLRERLHGKKPQTEPKA